MTFQLPPGLPREAARELERTCIAGGPDNMPWPTELHFRAGLMTVNRAVEESGYLVAPWAVNGAGQLEDVGGLEELADLGKAGEAAGAEEDLAEVAEREREDARLHRDPEEDRG